jgi:acetyl esterase/lipase
MSIRCGRAALWSFQLIGFAFGGTLAVSGTALAQGTPAAPAVKIDPDGTVNVPAHAVPMSSMLSSEGKAYVTEHLLNMQRPQMLVQENGIPVLLAGYLQRQRAVFRIERRDVTIGGVHAYDYTPTQGVSAANRQRVLINLHGGGFMGCWPACAELESMPVAELGRIRVISVDYRQGPKYRFPAASEDVASVYRELLKTYRPQDIGLYGCSAGGMLTGMAVAWFQKQGLPRPGAVGILCAGMTLASNGFGGDAAYTTAAIGESRAAPPLPRSDAPESAALPYFAGVSINDPLAARGGPPVAGKVSPPPALPKTLPRPWLEAPTLPLWPSEPPGTGFTPQPRPADWTPVFVSNVARPELHVFRPARASGQALLVIPGGAYWFVSVANEGAEVAERMTSVGITVFVLTYRLPGEGWKNRSDVPLQDAQRAMRVIRANASRFTIDATRVSVLGFSAGGHLTATLATQHAEQTYARVDAADELSPRPFAAGLVYPVVTMETRWTHAKSRALLLGETPSTKEVEHRSAERHVNSNTPPVFIVHAFDDEAVPVENTLRFMNAMHAAKRPVEAHLLQEGGHAFGVGDPGTPSASWIPLFATWLGRLAKA